MDFSKVIIGSASKLLQSTSRFELAIDNLQKKFEKGCPTPQELERLIKQKNQINTSLSKVINAVKPINVTAKTIKNVVTGLQAGVIILRNLPAPLPPFTPALVTNNFAYGLDLLDDLLKSGKGSLKIIPPVIETITSSFTTVQNKLALLDTSILGCVEEQLNDPTLDQAQIAESIGLALTETGNSSDSETNKQQSEELLNSLQPNSTNPLIYRGFKFIIENDPKNTLKVPARRIKAEKMDSKKPIILYNLEDQGYSYSATFEVLVNEAQFRVDQFLDT